MYIIKRDFSGEVTSHLLAGNAGMEVRTSTFESDTVE
jgi:hypothetical protein